jgi:tRNA (cytidine/uridine-2'-O-)-methyltransferase
MSDCAWHHPTKKACRYENIHLLPSRASHLRWLSIDLFSIFRQTWGLKKIKKRASGPDNVAERAQKHDPTRNAGPAMPKLSIALYQPDIAGNTGTIMRLAACLGLTVEVIEPAGFDLSDRNLKRSGMDYLAMVRLRRHLDWSHFERWRKESGRRLVLASTKAAMPYVDFAYAPDDILLFGRESAGVPDPVHESADARVLIPMQPEQRSINVAMSAAMIAGEALRQTGF